MYYRAITKIGATKAMALNITYSAWSIVFALLLLGTLPTVTSVIFGIVLIGSSLIAANGLPLLEKTTNLKSDIGLVEK